MSEFVPPAPPPPPSLVSLTREAVLLGVAWSGMLATAGVMAPLAALPSQRGYVPLVLPFTLLYALVLGLAYTRRWRASAGLAVFGNLLLLTSFAWGTGGLESGITAFLVDMPLLAALVGGRRAILVTSALAVAGLTAILCVGDARFLVGADDDLRFTRYVCTVVSMGFVAGLSAIVSNTTGGALVAARDREREANAARAYAEHVLRSVPTPVVITDRAGATIDANDAARALLRGDGPLAFEPLPGGLPGEELLLRPGGGAVPVRVTRSDLGEVTLVALVDLSQRIALDAERARAAEAAQEANAAKSRFLATMSHELRTPMNAILGYTELIDEGTTDPAVREDLGRISAAGHHLLRLIDDVLDISRIEAGRLDLQPAPHDVAALMEEVAAMVRPLVLEGGNRFVVDLATDLDEAVTDRARVSQVCVNLLTNAAQHTRDRTVILRASRAGERLRVDVIDEGVGIPAEKLPALFQPFGRWESGPRLGAGLGLAISRRLAEQLGGDLRAQSTVGRGSTFTFEWPATLPG